MFAEVEERERSMVCLAQSLQRLEYAGRIEPLLGCLLDERQFAVLVIEFGVATPSLFAPGPQEFAVQRGEQPRLDLRLVAQLMALGGPDRESLLGHIARIGFGARQAHGESIDRSIVRIDQRFEVE